MAMSLSRNDQHCRFTVQLHTTILQYSSTVRFYSTFPQYVSTSQLCSLVWQFHSNVVRTRKPYVNVCSSSTYNRHNFRNSITTHSIRQKTSHCQCQNSSDKSLWIISYCWSDSLCCACGFRICKQIVAIMWVGMQDKYFRRYDKAATHCQNSEYSKVWQTRGNSINTLIIINKLTVCYVISLYLWYLKIKILHAVVTGGNTIVSIQLSSLGGHEALLEHFNLPGRVGRL